MIENQNDTTKSQNDIIKNQNGIIKNQNDMIKNQNEIIKNQNDTIKNQNDMIKIQNEMFSRIIAIQNANNDLRTKCENLEQNFEQTMKNKLLPFQNLSEQIADINKTTQYIVAVAVKVAEVTDLSVKLVGGSRPHEGRVEINYQGMHGTVCDDSWDDKDAKVVCRMIGYSGGTAIRGPDQNFEKGVGNILLDDVECTGDESSLFVCPSRGMGTHNCDHSEDAGVRCTP